MAAILCIDSIFLPANTSLSQLRTKCSSYEGPFANLVVTARDDPRDGGGAPSDGLTAEKLTKICLPCCRRKFVDIFLRGMSKNRDMIWGNGW